MVQNFVQLYTGSRGYLCATPFGVKKDTNNLAYMFSITFLELPKKNNPPTK